MLENDGTLLMVSATVPNSIVRAPGVERPEGPGPEIIELENVTCMSNHSDVYSTVWQTEPSKRDFETATSRNRLRSKSEIFY